MFDLSYALSDGLFVSIFSIIVVFLIILLISVVIKLFQFYKEKPEKRIETVEPKKVLRIEDITDPDMMVAALVASIDYQEHIQGDVRVTSIKEIK